MRDLDGTKSDADWNRFRWGNRRLYRTIYRNSALRRESRHHFQIDLKRRFPFLGKRCQAFVLPYDHTFLSAFFLFTKFLFLSPISLSGSLLSLTIWLFVFLAFHLLSNLTTVKSRYNGFQGTEENHPLLAKSVIAKITMVDSQKQNPRRSII